MEGALTSTCGLQSVERFRPRRLRISFCLKMGIFSSGLAYRPHLSGENGHRKRPFSKTLSRMEIFENADSSFTCGRTKTVVFEYDDVIHHILEVFRMLCKACSRISIVLALSRGRDTLLVDACFLENGGIRSPC